MKFVPAQLQPLPPHAAGRLRPAFDKGDIFPLHCMRFELLDEVMARGWTRRHTENAAGILVKPMDRQRFEPPIGGRQSPGSYATVAGLKVTCQKIGEDAQSGKVGIRCRDGDQAGPFVDDREGRIQIKQRTRG